MTLPESFKKSVKAFTDAGWDKAEVWVTGTLGADAEGLDLSGPRDHVSVEVLS